MYTFDNPPQLETRESDFGREYQLPNKVWVPSVTTFLDKVLETPELDAWRERIGQEEADRYTKLSARIGTMFHDNMEKYIKCVQAHKMKPNDTITLAEYERIENTKDIVLELNELVRTNPVQYEMYIRTKKVIDTLSWSESNFVATELPVFSEKLGLAGRFDALHVNQHGEYSVIDFKSFKQKKTRKELVRYFIQGSIYACLIRDTYGVFPKSVHIISPCMQEIHAQWEITAVNDYLKPLNRLLTQFRRFQFDHSLPQNFLDIRRLPTDTGWCNNIFA